MIFPVFAAAILVSYASAVDLLTDIKQIQEYWGEMRPYADNAEDYFGVDYVGLPSGCQVVRQQLQSSWIGN